MAVLEYATIFSNVLRELYGQVLTCDDLYHSNSDIQIINGKDIKIPKLSVSGYKTIHEVQAVLIRVHIQTVTKPKPLTTTEILSLLSTLLMLTKQIW